MVSPQLGHHRMPVVVALSWSDSAEICVHSSKKTALAAVIEARAVFPIAEGVLEKSGGYRRVKKNIFNNRKKC